MEESKSMLLRMCGSANRLIQFFVDCDVFQGFTALSRACERGKHAVVEYLLSVKAKVNYSKDDNGEVIVFRITQQLH